MSLFVIAEVLETTAAMAVRKRGHLTIKDINENVDSKIKDYQSYSSQTRITKS